MQERIPNSNYEQLQYFISESGWSAEEVIKEVGRQTARSLTPLKGDRGLIIDESGNEKAGTKSVGVGHQYIGNVGKTCNAQNGVYVALCRERRVSLVGGRLYLPESWTADKKRCEIAKVPREHQKYRTKPEIAWEIIEELPEEVKYEWVGGDAVYGNSRELREKLRRSGRSYVLDVTSEMKVYVVDPQPYLPVKIGNKGRQATRLESAETPISLKDLIKTIPDEEWRRIEYREGTKGTLSKEAVLKKVWIWKKGRTEVEEAELLMSRREEGEEEKFSLCWELEGGLSVETALFRQTQRYWIERSFQEIKEQLGLHQYQVRSWVAWHHHVALTMMALHFILETQLENTEALPIMSCGDVKLLMSKILKNKLDDYNVLLETIYKRNQIRHLDILRRQRLI
jgi:SRSO17 transposase